jgi:hypothetical protein
MTDSQTSQVGPAICYQEVEALPEQQSRVDLAFDMLFEEVVKAELKYQPHRTLLCKSQLTPMNS